MLDHLMIDKILTKKEVEKLEPDDASICALLFNIVDSISSIT